MGLQACVIPFDNQPALQMGCIADQLVESVNRSSLLLQIGRPDRRPRLLGRHRHRSRPRPRPANHCRRRLTSCRRHHRRRSEASCLWVREEVFLPLSCGSLSADTTAGVNPVAAKNAAVFLAVSNVIAYMSTPACVGVSPDALLRPKLPILGTDLCAEQQS